MSRSRTLAACAAAAAALCVLAQAEGGPPNLERSGGTSKRRNYDAGCVTYSKVGQYEPFNDILYSTQVMQPGLHEQVYLLGCDRPALSKATVCGDDAGNTEIFFSEDHLHVTVTRTQAYYVATINFEQLCETKVTEV